MKKKLALLMALVLAVTLMAVPACAVEGPSANRDDTTQTELPDPNDPDSPDYVIIVDEDVPLGYIKVEDPDNEGGFIYIPEDDVPLTELPDVTEPDQTNDGGVKSPQTGMAGADTALALTGTLCAAGFVAVVVSKKKVAG